MDARSLPLARTFDDLRQPVVTVTSLHSSTTPPSWSSGSAFRPDGSHRAASRELHALVHEHFGRVQRTGHDCGDVQLDGFGRPDVRSDHAALDDHRGDVDLALHFGAFPDHEHVRAGDLPREMPVDADTPFEMELALEPGPVT